MADPVKKPLVWNRRYHTYAEQHGIFEVMQELMKELVIWKPHDPLMYIRDELNRIASSVFCPKVFFCGHGELASDVADSIARSCGAKFLTLEGLVDSTPAGVREHLSDYISGRTNDSEAVRKLLIATISRRLVMEDCINRGYVLYGFPQTRAQAMSAQMLGLLPRMIFALLPKGIDEDLDNASNFSGSGGGDPVKSNTQISAADIHAHREYFRMKETLATFNPKNCKIIPYSKWMNTNPNDIEAEFLGQMITRQNRGAPWIPRVVLIGPPGTGKSIIAEYLAVKFNILNVDWIEVVRAATLWKDEAGDEAKQYLEDLTPIAEEAIRTILKRKLGRDDCMKKGWVLHGFPETGAHARIMDEMGFTGNRVFLLSCPDTVCVTRMSKKRNSIMERKVPAEYSSLGIKAKTTKSKAAKLGVQCSTTQPKIDTAQSKTKTDELNIRAFPYSDFAIKKRLENFNATVKDVISHYGSFIIFVDASQSADAVCDFVTEGVVRPPNIRF